MFWKVVEWLTIASVSITVILTVFFLCAFDDSFYQKEFKKYAVQEQLPEHEVEGIHSEVIGFLKGEKPLESPFFTDREKKHMQEVRSLFNTTRILWIVSMCAALSVILFYLIKEKTNVIVQIIDRGVKACMILVLLLLTLSLASFPFLFELFHKILFESDSYVFDPSTEKIVVLYPQGLFSDFFVMLAGKIVLTCALISVSIYLYRKKKNKKSTQKRNL